MKKLFYGVLFLAIVGIGFVACEKEVVADTVTQKIQNESELVVKAAGPGLGLGIFTVQIDRPEGKVNKKGVDCMCRMCAGFCDFEWFPAFSYNGSNDNSEPTVAVELIDSEKAKLYFFETLDVDYVDNPIFYIDENVKIEDGVLDIEIATGEYQVTYSTGNIIHNDETHIYSSYITVDLN